MHTSVTEFRRTKKTVKRTNRMKSKEVLTRIQNERALIDAVMCEAIERSVRGDYLGQAVIEFVDAKLCTTLGSVKRVFDWASAHFTYQGDQLVSARF